MFGRKKKEPINKPTFNLEDLTSKLKSVGIDIVNESIVRQILIGKERRLAKLFYGVAPKDMKSDPKSIQEIADMFAIELEAVESILESAHSKLALIKL